MKTGFFCDDEKPCISRGDEKPKIKKLKEAKKVGCDSCGLHHKCNSPKMGIQGKGKKKILVIIDSPGANDDKTGKYLSGSSGKIVTDIINSYCDLKNDCWIMGAVQCHSEKEQKGIAVRACSEKVQKAIKDLQPAVILTIGKLAIDAVVDYKMTGRLSGLSLGDWVGYAIPDQEFKCYICPTWYPALLLDKRGETNKVIASQMRGHIFQAVKLADKPFYIHNYMSDIITTEDKDDAIALLQKIREKKFMAFDYETTGIKPYRKEHKIKTASISDGLFGYAFPFFDDEEFRTEWKLTMLSPDTGKIAHNAKFESLWTKNKAGLNNKGGYWPKNIIACTMLDAHIIHNKKKTNLKFLTYVHFGIAGYDSDIDSYLESTTEEKEKYGANGINQIDKAPMDKLLLYNALDSLFTYKLWEIQRMELIPKLTSNGSLFFLDSVLELAKAENKGLLLDVPNAELEYKKLTKKMERIEYKISISDELKKWDKEKPFRASAPGDLTHLLFDCLKIKANKDDLTPTGKPKADIEAVGKYDLDIVKDVLYWRKYKKVRDTYLKGFITEATDGIIHTSLNLHTVDTYRSSSNDPNLQNIPARDTEVMNLLRKLLIARPGHKLIEFDYKAMEAVIIACYNKDPNWIKYVSDISSDMHRDMGAKLFIRKKEDVLKTERQCAKNGFVFPTIYGSYWKNTAANLWDDCEPETKIHLKSEGIKTLDDMREHVKKIERWFWEDQFPVGYEWMNKAVKDYEMKGYITLLSGFKCYGPLSRNQIVNTPVQGTASHCKLWTLNRISKLIEKKKMNSRILLEIHDSIIPDTDPAEEAYLDYQIWLYGTQKIKEYWPWLIVPLFIEKKVSAVNGNWAEMENMGLLKGEK